MINSKFLLLLAWLPGTPPWQMHSRAPGSYRQKFRTNDVKTSQIWVVRLAEQHTIHTRGQKTWLVESYQHCLVGPQVAAFFRTKPLLLLCAVTASVQATWFCLRSETPDRCRKSRRMKPYFRFPIGLCLRKNINLHFLVISRQSCKTCLRTFDFNGSVRNFSL